MEKFYYERCKIHALRYKLGKTKSLYNRISATAIVFLLFNEIKGNV